MRILWVSHFLLHPKTGFGALQRSRNLLEYLGSRHEVTLVSLVRGGAFGQAAEHAEAQASLLQFCRKVVFIPHLAGGYTSRLAALGRAIVSRESYSTELYSSRELREAVSAILKNGECDLLHADTMGLVESPLPSIQVPTVLTHHNIESAMMERRSALATSPVLKAFFASEARALRRHEKRFAPRFSMNVTVSDADRVSLATIAPEARAGVVENPVDTEYFHNSDIVAPGHELLFAGSLNWYPNADAASYFCEQIWPKLSQRQPDASVSFIGGDREKDPFGARFGSDRILFRGFVDDVRPYFRRARVFICPMRDGGGTRLKLVDAFAAGTPVVSTTLGCEGLDAVHEKHLLIADSPEDFAACVERLLRDDVLCRQLSENARGLVENRYSQRVLGSRLEAIYEAAQRA